jgi:hypothetical protein
MNYTSSPPYAAMVCSGTALPSTSLQHAHQPLSTPSAQAVHSNAKDSQPNLTESIVHTILGVLVWFSIDINYSTCVSHPQAYGDVSMYISKIGSVSCAVYCGKPSAPNSAVSRSKAHSEEWIPFQLFIVTEITQSTGLFVYVTPEYTDILTSLMSVSIDVGKDQAECTENDLNDEWFSVRRRMKCKRLNGVYHDTHHAKENELHDQSPWESHNCLDR